MSYSFTAQGATKEEAQRDAVAKFDKVVHDMPVHAADRQQVLAHLYGLVAITREPKSDEQVFVSMSGYVNAVPNESGGPTEIGTVNASCSVSVMRPYATSSR